MSISIARRGSATALALLSVTLIACSAPERQSANEQPQRSSAGMMAGGMMMGMDQGMMQGGMMRGGMMGGGMEDMRSIRGLLANHQSIERTVEDLPNGVRTVTTSDDPRVVELIRTHVRQMDARFERDQPIRNMDPLFRELFARRHEATLEYRDVPGGIEVVHSSSNPEVVRLIRQHARHFVSRAADEGMAAAMGPTPLPEGYKPRSAQRR